jgi:hypothetical protein
VLGVDVRIGTSNDVKAIAALSQVEFDYRSTPPIYAHPQSRTLAQARAHHERLLEEGVSHFLARRDRRDVALVTVEFTSGAAAVPDRSALSRTDRDTSLRSRSKHRHAPRRGRSALGTPHRVRDGDISRLRLTNPLSRPFWLGVGFEPTGYRLRRTIDASYVAPAQTDH